MDLLLLNHRGLFPFEEEDEKQFFLRIATSSPYIQNIKELSAALLKCKKIFDVEPDWVKIIEQQKGLTPWQGAVMWLQKDAHGNLEPLIQISPRLQSFLLRKFYAKEEVISHELIHAMRLPLHSSRFEEIIAFHTSHNPFRRYFGPLFRHPYEVYVLFVAVLLGWLGLFWTDISFFVWIPWGVCLFAISRLFFSHLVFKRCKAKLTTLLKDKSKALAFLSRLTDTEIAMIAKKPLKEIKIYTEEMKSKHVRWKMLCHAYPFDPVCVR